jgi:hypothetical protein
MCNACKAAYMRNWRKNHPLNDEQRFKANARSYANAYQRRGLVKKEPCMLCGSENSQKHHPDYSKPLFIIWLCKECHQVETRTSYRETIKKYTNSEMLAARDRVKQELIAYAKSLERRS